MPGNVFDGGTTLAEAQLRAHVADYMNPNKSQFVDPGITAATEVIGFPVTSSDGYYSKPQNVYANITVKNPEKKDKASIAMEFFGEDNLPGNPTPVMMLDFRLAKDVADIAATLASMVERQSLHPVHALATLAGVTQYHLNMAKHNFTYHHYDVALEHTAKALEAQKMTQALRQTETREAAVKILNKNNDITLK